MRAPNVSSALPRKKKKKEKEEKRKTVSRRRKKQEIDEEEGENQRERLEGEVNEDGAEKAFSREVAGKKKNCVLLGEEKKKRNTGKRNK